jgi:hypothetical protein
MQKSYSYLFGAMIIFIALLVFQYKFTLYLIALTSPDAIIGPDLRHTNRYFCSHNIVVYGGMGLVLFFLACALDSFILDSDRQLSHLRQLSRLATLLLRWAVIFIFGDIVLQNWSGSNITIWNYTMRGRTIAAFCALELCALLTFFSAQKAKPPVQY